jgi:hypothetical protein
VIGFLGFRTVTVQPVSMLSATIPFHTRVKSLGLTNNRRFAWDDQINIVCRRVYFKLKRLWTTASLTPVGTWLQLAGSLVVPLFLYCDVIFPKKAVRLRGMSLLFGIRRSEHEHILGYSAHILGLPLGRYNSFRICCQMYRIVSTRKPDYVYRELQFGRSARLSNLITMPRRRTRSLFGVRFSGFVCLRPSGATLLRGGSEVDAVRLLRKLLSLIFCDDPLRERRERGERKRDFVFRFVSLFDICAI